MAQKSLQQPAKATLQLGRVIAVQPQSSEGKLCGKLKKPRRLLFSFMHFSGRRFETTEDKEFVDRETFGIRKGVLLIHLEGKLPEAVSSKGEEKDERTVSAQLRARVNL